jgi:hypothetical protein
LIGQTVGPYRISAQLGEGVVYEAEDLRLRRRVALKFLPATLQHDPAATARPSVIGFSPMPSPASCASARL